MTTLALRPGSGYALSTRLDRSLSNEASNDTRLGFRINDYETSITVGALKHASFVALNDAFTHAQETGWDGYNALPADPGAYSYALEFLDYLPTTIPLPEIAVDTDGDIAIEWDFSPRRVLSVRVSRDGTLNYAGLVGHASFHGTELLREGIPSAIWTGIERVIGAHRP
jgi:hypothetical protein